MKKYFAIVVLALMCSTIQPSLFSQEKTKKSTSQEATGKKKETTGKKPSPQKTNTKKKATSAPQRTTTRETGVPANNDRDPSVGKTTSGKIVFEGSRGGHYYLTESQNKVYVQDFIGSKIIGKTHDGKNIYEGPRGGHFYYSDKGDKVYVKK